MMGEAMVMVTELHRHKYKLSPVSPTLCRFNQLGTAIHDPALFGALAAPPPFLSNGQSEALFMKPLGFPDYPLIRFQCFIYAGGSS